MSRPRALVTGASSGIGRAIACELAGRGWDLAVTARREPELNELAAELGDRHGSDVRVHVADLLDPMEIDGLAEVVLRDSTGPPDLLALVAGRGHAGAWIDGDADTERDTLRLSVEATTRLARRLVPPMVERGHGRVLAVSSLGAFLPGPGIAVYYASRAYVLSWARSLAVELRETGVSVTCVCPGPVPTGFQGKAGIRMERMPSLLTLSPERVARAAVAGALAGRDLVIPGWANRLVVLAARVVPWRWSARVVHYFQKRRT